MRRQSGFTWNQIPDCQAPAPNSTQWNLPWITLNTDVEDEGDKEHWEDYLKLNSVTKRELVYMFPLEIELKFLTASGATMKMLKQQHCALRQKEMRGSRVKTLLPIMTDQAKMLGVAQDWNI